MRIICVLFTFCFISYAVPIGITLNDYNLDKSSKMFLKKQKLKDQEKHVLLDMYNSKKCTINIKNLESFYKEEKDKKIFKFLTKMIIAAKSTTNSKEERQIIKITYSSLLNAFRTVKCENEMNESFSAFMITLSAYSSLVNSLEKSKSK